MLSIPEQFSTATKAQFETQLAMFNALTSKALEGVANVIELNVSAAKASVEESNVAIGKLLAAKDPQEFFTLTAAQAQPNAEKALSYGRHLAAILFSTQAEFTKAAEAQIAEARSKATALVDDITNNAPAGSESAVAMLKSAIDNASAGYERLAKATMQAVEVVEAQVVNATEQFSSTAEKAAPKAARK